MNGNRINILSRLSLGGMEMAGFALFLLFLDRKAAGDSLPWLVILLFYPIAAVLNISLRSRIRRWKHFLLLNGIGGLMVFGILLGFRVLLVRAPGFESGVELAARILNPDQAEFWIFLTSGAAWGLGCRLALLKNSFSILFSEFQFGLALLFIALFVEHHLQLNLPYLVPLNLFFFSFALIGAGLAHGNEHAGWTSNRYFGTWVVFLLVAVALILSAGLLITVLVSPAFVQFLLSLLYQAGEFLLGILGRILRFFLSLLPSPDPSLFPPPPPSQPVPRPEDWSPFFLISDATREILRILWTIMVSSMLLVALWRISSQILDWLRRRMGTSTGDEVEPLPGAFRADLRILLFWIFDTLSLKWLFRLLARRKGRGRESNSIRQAYTRLLQWAAAKGCRREISQTPFEYLPRLFDFLPEAGEDFIFITRQYVQARYSISPPAGEVLEEVKHRWENIQRMKDRERRKDKKKMGDEAYDRSEK
ncbi:MAG: hypothetical protein H6Q43_2054 [Deltaproteobacteria bacterium]|nr:hypothetical protein [Deltaproteobacteria bacterium]